MPDKYHLELKDYLLTNITWIDSQHRRLLERINALLNVVIDNRNYEEVGTTVKFLENYVKAHFGTEEKFMEHYKYPGRHEHRKQHRIFTARIEKIRKQFHSAGSKKPYANILAKELWEWYKSHIEKLDSDFADFLRGSKGVELKQSPDEVLNEYLDDFEDED